MDNFVSRGGIKLQSAIKNFKLEIKNFVVLDVGSSTGGFVDCLLQNGAKKVYALDTCYGELAWTLRNDQRVVVMERTNILHLDHLDTPGESKPTPGVDLITIDAGWTRLEKVLPVVRKFLKPEGIIIALLKPHYEADKRDLIKGVLPPEKAEEIKNKFIKTMNEKRQTINDCIESPILGGAGNKEYLLLMKS